jgi:hypothetical protein
MEQKMQTGSKVNSSNHEEEVEAGAVGRDAASWESAGWWSHTVLSASHLDSGRGPPVGTWALVCRSRRLSRGPFSIWISGFQGLPCLPQPKPPRPWKHSFS